MFQAFTLLLLRVGNLLLPSSGLLLQPGRCQPLTQPVPLLEIKLCGSLLRFITPHTMAGKPHLPAERQRLLGVCGGHGVRTEGTALVETDVAFK